MTQFSIDMNGTGPKVRVFWLMANGFGCEKLFRTKKDAREWIKRAQAEERASEEMARIAEEDYQREQAGE